MACEVRNEEVNSQCAELLVRPLYLLAITYALYNVRTFIKIGEYLTALFIIIAKVGSLIIQPLQI